MTAYRSNGQDPLVEVAGDADGAALLRRNLETLAADHHGTRLGDLCRRVLDGRAPVSELRTDPEVSALVAEGTDHYRDQLAAMSDDERDALFRIAHELALDPEP